MALRGQTESLDCQPEDLVGWPVGVEGPAGWGGINLKQRIIELVARNEGQFVQKSIFLYVFVEFHF